MIVVDTSVWIEFFKGSSSVWNILQREMKHQQVLAIEGVFGELLQGAKNKRETDILLSYWHNLPHGDGSGVWLEAGVLSARRKLISKGVGLIDACLIIVAEKHDATVWSLDRKLLAVLKPRRRYVPLPR